MTAQVEKVVRAERFELVDEEGRVRAVLGLEDFGREDKVLRLSLYDSEGRTPSPIYDPIGRPPIVSLQVGPEQSAQLELTTRAGEPSVQIRPAGILLMYVGDAIFLSVEGDRPPSMSILRMGETLWKAP